MRRPSRPVSGSRNVPLIIRRLSALLHSFSRRPRGDLICPLPVALHLLRKRENSSPPGGRHFTDPAHKSRCNSHRTRRLLLDGLATFRFHTLPGHSILPLQFSSASRQRSPDTETTPYSGRNSNFNKLYEDETIHVATLFYVEKNVF